MMKIFCIRSGRYIILSLLMAFIPGHNHAQVSMDSIQIKAPSPMGAMIRSAILPGWGQAYNQKRLKALVVFGIEGGLSINAAYLNNRALSSVTEDERLFYEENRNQTIWWFFGIYLLNILDAYVDAQLFSFDVGPDLTRSRAGPAYTFRFTVSLN